jgi:hypothetical protein
MRWDWELITQWVLIAAGIAGIFYFFGGESETAKQRRVQAAEKERIASEQYRAKRELQCARVTEALEVVKARGRADLAEAANKSIAACRRIEVEDCDYKVELLYELGLAGRISLANDMRKIGDDCSRQLEFATKHGLAAFRDHHKLLTEALDGARDEHENRRADDYLAPPEDDYGARGRR